MLVNFNTIKKNQEFFWKKYQNENSMANDLLDISINLNQKYKNALIEIIARNLVAWENSKDKREGLLPEIYLTNKFLYKELTGKEFNERKALKKYYE